MPKKPSSFQGVIDGNFCRYIEGDIKKHTESFCANKRKKNSSYCEYHHKICCPKTVTKKDLEGLIRKYIDL